MRESGILLHVSSLPNKYGIGALGKEAYDFVDFLEKSGQKLWQVLPIGPTSYGDSPYQSPSSFAFNPYFIDLDLLAKDGLLDEEELKKYERNDKRVDYGYIYNTRFEILYKAYLNKHIYQAEFDEFLLNEKDWVDDYALFMVLKIEHHNKPWNEWYDNFKFRVDHAMEWAKNEFKDKIEAYKFYQFLFLKQWLNLKSYANSKGIRIIGDMPIYCAFDSADVWANHEMYQLNDRLEPIFVAGCPPDCFTPDGQLWGNPLYDYDQMKANNYSWWVKRVNHSLRIFDILRIDHFRGFAGYYAIPFGDINARGGHWVDGPGYDLFKAINSSNPNAEIIAENLGFITPDVDELLESCGYPGMNIFQFELGDKEENIPLKNKYKENTVFYSGTHDNQTIMSYYNSLDELDKKLIDSICKIKITDKANFKIFEYCMKTNAKYCITPIQDFIGLSDNEGRMNIPSTASGNWSYIARNMDFSDELAEYILKVTKKTKRIEE